MKVLEKTTRVRGKYCALDRALHDDLVRPGGLSRRYAVEHLVPGGVCEQDTYDFEITVKATPVGGGPDKITKDLDDTIHNLNRLIVEERQKDEDEHSDDLDSILCNAIGLLANYRRTVLFSGLTD